MIRLTKLPDNVVPIIELKAMDFFKVADDHDRVGMVVPTFSRMGSKLLEGRSEVYFILIGEDGSPQGIDGFFGNKSVIKLASTIEVFT